MVKILFKSRWCNGNWNTRNRWKQYTFNEKGEMYDANKSADNKNTTEQIKTETVFKSTNKKDKSSKVKTGDETVVGMWSILMFISGLFGIRGFKRWN